MMRTAVQVAPALSLRRPSATPSPMPRTGAPPRRSYRVEGVICLVVAIAWGFAAQFCYREIGTLMLFNALSGVMKLQESPPALHGPGGVPPARGVQQSLTWFPPATPGGPATRTTSPLEADLATQPRSVRTPARVESEQQRQALAARQLEESIAVGETTRITWAVATFVFAGLIGAAGLAGAFRTTAGRLPPFALLAITLGACVGGLAVMRLSKPHEGETLLNHLIWVASITQTRYSWAGHLTLASLTALLACLFALRPTSDPRRWLIAAVVFMFLGTFLTLAGISALESFGRFPPLPAWHYAVVAAGQSFFAWVLMIMLNWRHPAQGR